MPANNKGADQPARPRSLISAFVKRSLVSTEDNPGIRNTSKVELAPVAELAGFSLACT